jgi:hypothetical protein
VSGAVALLAAFLAIAYTGCALAATYDAAARRFGWPS